MQKQLSLISNRSSLQVCQTITGMCSMWVDNTSTSYIFHRSWAFNFFLFLHMVLLAISCSKVLYLRILLVSVPCIWLILGDPYLNSWSLNSGLTFLFLLCSLPFNCLFAVIDDMHLIHTDLKPENILLVSPEYIRVPDYKVLILVTVLNDMV